jgi:hypothetical protein
MNSNIPMTNPTNPTAPTTGPEYDCVKKPNTSQSSRWFRAEGGETLTSEGIYSPRGI